MSRLKVVVTDYEYQSLERERQIINGIGADFCDTFQCRTEDQVIEAAGDADAIIVQYAPITRRVIENLKNCKVIATYGIGTDKIDVRAATECGICVANVPDYGIEEVSDHTILLLLAVARKLTFLNQAVKSGVWDYKLAKPIYRIRGKELGVIGFGKIPRLVARKAHGFGLNISSYDPFVTEEVCDAEGCRKVEFDDLIQRCDFISIHVPLTSETRHMFNAEVFKKMKKTAYLISVGRGPVVDEVALIEALQKGEIAGAALDVTEKEPIAADNPLLRMDNVIITPHAAWYSEEAAAALQRGAAEQVAQVLQGRCYPRNLVNRELKGKLDLLEGIMQ